MLLDVERVGTVRVKFTQADMTRFATKKIRKPGHVFRDLWYDIDMRCEIGLADSSGVLKFTVKCHGELCGTTTFVCQYD